MMLHTKYEGSWPFGFSQEDFFHVFPILVGVKHMNPGVEPFLTTGALFKQTW